MKKTVVLIVALVAMALIAWFGRPAYRAHKEKRFAAAASAAMTNNEPRKAMLNAHQALVLNSNNLAALRVMAELADATRSPQAIAWRQRIATLDPALENQLAVAASALRHEPPPFPLATRVLQEAGTNAQDSVSFHMVSAQLALRQGRIADAEASFSRASQIEPTNELHRLNLAVIRLESKDSAVHAGARGELERLQAHPQFGVNALRPLVVHYANREQFAEAERYSAALLKNTNSTFGDRLEHLTVLHRAKNPSAASFLAELQRQAGTNVLQASDLVARMTALGMAREALAWVETLPRETQDELPLPLTVADAYAATKNWRAMEQFLTRQQWREREFVRRALLSYAMRSQNVGDIADVHWREAVERAVERPETALILSQLAGNWGWTNQAEALLWQAASTFPKERWPLEALHNGYARQRNGRGLYAVTAVSLERNPDNPLLQNNWAALALLLRTNETRAHQLAREVYEKDTNHFAFVSTYAWSLHAQGKTTEALRVIETLKPAELEHPSVAGYYGVILAAAGQRDKAQQYFARAEAAPILAEEQAMIANAKRR